MYTAVTIVTIIIIGSLFQTDVFSLSNLGSHSVHTLQSFPAKIKQNVLFFLSILHQQQNK